MIGEQVVAQGGPVDLALAPAAVSAKRRQALLLLSWAAHVGDRAQAVAMGALHPLCHLWLTSAVAQLSC